MALRVGDYVKQTSQPELGIGRVISIGDGRKGHHLFPAGWETDLLQQLSRLGTGEFSPSDP